MFVFGFGFRAAHMADSAIKSVAAWDSILAFLIGYCGLIFCALRFGFLLVPATIAEEKIGLLRAWQISQGNFWRMFGVALAIFLPIMALLLCLLYLAGGFPQVPAGVSGAEAAALQNAAGAAFAARMQHYWYLYYSANALISLLMIGLTAGAESFAYRALVEEK
jgi:hypothetical protein